MVNISLDQKLMKIRDALIRRRNENTDLGVEAKDNVFDTRLLALYGEEFCQSRHPNSKRAQGVNEAGWDLLLDDGRRVQVKTRAVYSHNNDGIHIDFNVDPAFDCLYLLLVDESLKHMCSVLIERQALEKVWTSRKNGGFRLSSIRSKYAFYAKLGRLVP